MPLCKIDAIYSREHYELGMIRANKVKTGEFSYSSLTVVIVFIYVSCSPIFFASVPTQSETKMAKFTVKNDQITKLRKGAFAKSHNKISKILLAKQCPNFHTWQS